tara:strand:+ start:14586 stop:14843 length:258 start_codon:yes stop_codon:yes gene_type:complete
MKTFNNYTELENKLMNGIINTWGDTGCDNTYLDDACEDAGITMKVGRGVVSSLIKKGIVLECLPEHSFEINLTDEGEALLEVPEV